MIDIYFKKQNRSWSAGQPVLSGWWAKRDEAKRISGLKSVPCQIYGGLVG